MELSSEQPLRPERLAVQERREVRKTVKVKNAFDSER
jgi:hypothetical protein